MFSRLRSKARSGTASADDNMAPKPPATSDQDGKTKTSIELAMQYKEDGNKAFAKGDYKDAERSYLQALESHPSPPIHTNLALAYLKLNNYNQAALQARSAIRLDSSNMKAHYYLAQALSLHPQHESGPDEVHEARSNTELALREALTALDLCVADITKNHGKGMGSLALITECALKCYRAKWDEKERRRIASEGLRSSNTAVDMARGKREAIITKLLASEERMRIRGIDMPDEWVKEVADALQEDVVMEYADENENAEEASQQRKPPDWLIDDITFNPMVDPVMTKTGTSYERASILKHLERSQTDPLTREPLSMADLRPNLALRAACREFLDGNGWAVDW